MSLLRRNAIADLVYLKDARLSYMREWVPNFTTTLNFNYKIYQTIPGRIEFIKTNEFNMKDTIKNFRVFSPGINIVYTPGAKFLQGSERVRFLKGKLPRFNFTYVFSAKKLGSDFNFHKMELIMDERLPSPIGHTNIRLIGTKLFGAAPYPLLHIHSGNQSFMYNKERFTNMLETEFIADQQLTLMIEHHFDGFFFNKIPVWRKLGLREVFTTKMAVSSLDPKKVSFSDLPTELKGLNGFYAEIGFGIENILKLLRVDFSWRLTQKKPT
jgi:intein/homing endonuclease